MTDNLSYLCKLPLPLHLSTRYYYTKSLCFFLLLCVLGNTQIYGQPQMESLNNGIVAVRTSNNEVFVSWRLLAGDSADVGFNLYRGGTLLNESPITNTTNFVDETATDGSYTVRTVINGQEGPAFGATSVWETPYMTLDLQRPSGGISQDGVNYTYTPNDCSVGDLDGDGTYEIILKWDPTNSQDNSRPMYTGNVFIDAYTLEGDQLWRIDLGKNIRAGAHYTQFMVYDLDGDGKAEIACKTADGTMDGVGNVIGDHQADYRNTQGYILSGPEYLTVFNGQTGAAMATADYIPPRGNVSSWGDSYGNRVDRFLAGIAYLDGNRPSLLMCRGYYTRTVIAAWDWQNDSLTQRWIFDTEDGNYAAYEGQGAHSLTIGDVDGDGKDEITYGACAIDDNGEGLYSTGIGHGDALHLSDMDPDRPGLEVFMVHETPADYGEHGVEMRDAATGEIIWSRPGNGADVGRGVAMDIDPTHRGYEAWGSRGGLNSSKGEQISDARPPMNFGVWWDGDFIREFLDNTIVSKWDYINMEANEILDSRMYGGRSNNGTKATPSLSADILGDWREEIIWRHQDNDKLLIFTTTIPTEHRIYTLMHNPQYRTAIAWQNVGYNQPPHPSFYLGDGMAEVPTPNIQMTTDLSPPSLINLGAVGRNSAVDLDWVLSDVTADLEIYRDTINGEAGGVKIAALGAGTTFFTDENVENGITYYYRINSLDKNNQALSSNSVQAIPDVLKVALSAIAGDSSVTLTWEIMGENGTQEVYREVAENSEGSIKVATLDLTARTYEDTNLVPGTTYFYWIETIDETGNIIASNRISVTPSYLIFFQEKEEGFCTIEGTVDTNHPGYTGTGFSNTNNETGAGIDYRVQIGISKTYYLEIRYANGSDNSRPVSIIVDEIAVGFVPCVPTGEWSNWNIVSFSVYLESGEHDIRLEALEEKGLSNIDYLAIRGVMVNPITCDTDLSNSQGASKETSIVKVFPNPSKNIFYIQTEENQIPYQVYNMNGQKLEQGVFDATANEFGSTLSPGLYVLELQLLQKRVIKRIIKIE